MLYFRVAFGGDLNALERCFVTFDYTHGIESYYFAQKGCYRALKGFIAPFFYNCLYRSNGAKTCVKYMILDSLYKIV